MSTIEQQAQGGNKGAVRYLTPLEIDTKVKVKYCRFKKNNRMIVGSFFTHLFLELLKLQYDTKILIG